MTTAVLWLRRDLRLCDHPALAAAADAQRLICVFCFDDALLAGRHRSGPRTQFMLECLAALDDGLRELGSRLVIRRGDPATELRRLTADADAHQLHFSADAGPFGRRRQAEVKRALQEDGVSVTAHPGLFCVDSLQAIRTGAGGPYTVFTPFHRSWLQEPRRAVLPAPRALPSPPDGITAGELPTLGELGLESELADPMPGGELAARAALHRVLAGPGAAYAAGHDPLSGGSVSRLSPYLHFGCLSPRELEHRLSDGDGPQAFARQVCWRDFYAHVLGHFPDNAREEFQERYRGKLSWSDDRERFDAWCDGRTGYPAVDAGMRQLRREGWMHNRARLIVGSFLTKDLGVDWRWGERWFMRWLLDGDQANNNGNWQWIASVGTDPAPVFRRIYNPARQQQRFDPDGVYVRRYVPELADVPLEYLIEPASMPAEVQKRVGCVIGRDYPEPIVDHAVARREALDRYRG